MEIVLASIVPSSVQVIRKGTSPSPVHLRAPDIGTSPEQLGSVESVLCDLEHLLGKPVAERPKPCTFSVDLVVMSGEAHSRIGCLEHMVKERNASLETTPITSKGATSPRFQNSVVYLPTFGEP